MEEIEKSTLNIGSSAEKETNQEKPINSLTVQNSKDLENQKDNNIIDDVIIKNALNTLNVKEVINLASTKKALENDETVDKLVDEKTEELLNDALAKKVESETERIRAEVEKVKQQEEKEIAELKKIKSKLQEEIEGQKIRIDKAEVFFKSNESVLRCIGVKHRLSLLAMQILMFPAALIFAIFHILLLPFTLLGYAIEEFMDIIELICGKITKSGWRIVLTIIVSVIICALLLGVYFCITRFLVNIF